MDEDSIELRQYVVSVKTDKMIPIDPSAQEHNRYKMHRLAVSINGKKISFLNLEQVSKDLQIPPSYIPMYLKTVLKLTAKQEKGNKWVLFTTSYLSLEVLDKHLKTFLTTFILCPTCNLPELYFLSEEAATNPNSKDSSEDKNKKSRKKNDNNSIANNNYLVTLVCRGCPWESPLDKMKALPPNFFKIHCL